MSVAAAIRQMLAAGLTVEQALVAVEAMEQSAASEKQRSSGAVRQARYRERKALLVTLQASQVTESVTSDACAVAEQKEKSPTPPIRKTTTPNHPSDDLPLSPETAPRKAKRAKPRTSIDQNAQPIDKDRAAAAEYGLTTEAFRIEWRNFRDHHISRGTLMADWPAAWRTWLAKSAEFGRIKPQGAGLVIGSAAPDWRVMLDIFCKTRNWSWAKASPEPGHPDCKIPADIIAEFAGRLPPNPFAARAPEWTRPLPKCGKSSDAPTAFPQADERAA
jgi:hypothetical protein